ncbi:MAG: hypothetical protein HUU46_07425 [Candidatus Hydrogenedentes bacterium]|nr:hypothetical protein [Candidatus Hydrogenedentota bacterium]
MRDTYLPTRQEIDDQNERLSKNMEDHGEKLKVTADDIETIRQLREDLDRSGGTTEGLDAVDRAVDSADGAASEVFDQQDRDLQEVHEENEEFQEELDEGKEAADANLDRVSDTLIETQAAIEHMEATRDAIQEDLKLLSEQLDAAKDSLKRSRELEAELRSVTDWRRE